nr:hypothetical protein [uncultured Anaerostipes sp.]
MQKGYHNDLPYWVCDDCGTMLNEQAGFTEDCGEWTCNKERRSSSDDELITVLGQELGERDEREINI